jgi:hypothetical protein
VSPCSGAKLSAMTFLDREPEGDATPADWAVRTVAPFGSGVRSLVPPVFEAYARVFHPAVLGGRPVRWAEVARANARTAHPGMEWAAITGGYRYVYDEVQPGIFDKPPEDGSPPPEVARVLGAVLLRFTGVREYWFAVWEGYGGLPMNWATAPARVRMPERAMHLFRGTPDDVGESFETGAHGRGASLWWPDDRAWCVASDVDLMSSYVGGSADCIAAVLAEPALESGPVAADQSVRWDGDLVNPPVPGPDRPGRRG